MTREPRVVFRSLSPTPVKVAAAAATSIDKLLEPVIIMFDTLNVCKVQPLARPTGEGTFRAAMVEEWLNAPTDAERRVLHDDIDESLRRAGLPAPVWGEPIPYTPEGGAQGALEDWVRRGKR